MQMRKIQHEALLTEWKQIITTCRGSGLTISQWCRQNNVKESRYYYWLREIRNEALAMRAPAANQSVFAEVTVPALASGQSSNKNDVCAVIRINQTAVEIYNGASPSTITAIIQALQPPC